MENVKVFLFTKGAMKYAVAARSLKSAKNLLDIDDDNFDVTLIENWDEKIITLDEKTMLSINDVIGYEDFPCIIYTNDPDLHEE